MKNLNKFYAVSLISFGTGIFTGSNVYAQSVDKTAFQGFYAGAGAGLNTCNVKGSVTTETKSYLGVNFATLNGWNIGGRINIPGFSGTQEELRRAIQTNGTYSANSVSKYNEISKSYFSGNINLFGGYNYRNDQFVVGAEAGVNKLLSSFHGDISERFSLTGVGRIGTILEFNRFDDPEVLLFASVGFKHSKYSNSLASSTNFMGGLGVEKRLGDKFYLRLSYNFTPGKTISGTREINDLERVKTDLKISSSHAVLIGTAIHF